MIDGNMEIAQRRIREDYNGDGVVSMQFRKRNDAGRLPGEAGGPRRGDN